MHAWCWSLRIWVLLPHSHNGQLLSWRIGRYVSNLIILCRTSRSNQWESHRAPRSRQSFPSLTHPPCSLRWGDGTIPPSGCTSMMAPCLRAQRSGRTWKGSSEPGTQSVMNGCDVLVWQLSQIRQNFCSSRNRMSTIPCPPPLGSCYQTETQAHTTWLGQWKP
jgi:hypothetical protein